MSHRYMFAIQPKKWGYVIVDLLYFTPSRWPLIFYCDENSLNKISKLLTNECLNFVFGQQQNSLVCVSLLLWNTLASWIKGHASLASYQNQAKKGRTSKFFPSSDFQMENNKHSKTEPPATKAAQLAAKQKRQTFHLSQSWPGLTSSLRLAVSPCIGV